MLWSLVLGVGIVQADHDSEAANDPELLFWVIVPYGGSPAKAASRVTGVWVSSRPEADLSQGAQLTQHLEHDAAAALL
jgi:hypothetical protein